MKSTALVLVRASEIEFFRLTLAFGTKQTAILQIEKLNFIVEHNTCIMGLIGQPVANSVE